METDAKFRKITSLSVKHMVISTEAFSLALLTLMPGNHEKIRQLFEADRLKRKNYGDELDRVFEQNPDLLRKFRINVLNKYGEEFDAILDSLVPRQGPSRALRYFSGTTESSYASAQALFLHRISTDSCRMMSDAMVVQNSLFKEGKRNGRKSHQGTPGSESSQTNNR